MGGTRLYELVRALQDHGSGFIRSNCALKFPQLGNMLRRYGKLPDNIFTTVMELGTDYIDFALVCAESHIYLHRLGNVIHHVAVGQLDVIVIDFPRRASQLKRILPGFLLDGKAFLAEYARTHQHQGSAYLPVLWRCEFIGEYQALLQIPELLNVPSLQCKSLD